MLAFKDIQDEVRDLIRAHAYFTGLTVESNLGDKDNEIETALNDKGFAVEVLQVIDGKGFQATPGRALFMARIVIRIKLNAILNAATGGAGKNIYEAVEKATQAILGYQRQTAGEKTFEPDTEDYLVSYRDDKGLVAYDITFRKQVVF